MIEFQFGTYKLTNVKAVQISSRAADGARVDATSKVGKQVRSIVVTGYIIKGMHADSLAAQAALETELRDEGVADITYTGWGTISDCRFESLEFEEYRGNPVLPYEITFITEVQNIQSHAPVQVGSLVLNEGNGYHDIQVSDSIGTQGPDEQMSNLLTRKFTVSGRLIGSDRDAINDAQVALIAAVESKTTLVLTLSTSTVGGYQGSYTVRPRSLDFESPSQLDQQADRQFSFECETQDNYAIEPYTLGEAQANVGGVVLDVVTTYDTDRSFEIRGTTTDIIEEKLSYGGKKYFTDYTAYEVFRLTLESAAIGANVVASIATGLDLILTSSSVGEFTRDGNFPTGANAKRYSATVSCEFTWVKTQDNTNYEVGTTRFGVLFQKIPTVSFSASVNEVGDVTSRSINVSGQISSAQLAQVEGLMGTSVSWGGLFTNMIVTNVSVSNANLHKPTGGVADKVYEVTISAAQLDNASQAIYLLASTFKIKAPGTTYNNQAIPLSLVTSMSKSLSNRWDPNASGGAKFVVTSINMSISGEVWVSDTAGAPATPTVMVDIFDKIDALLTARQSVKGGNTTVAGEFLPANADIDFFLNSINIGSWEPFTKPNAPNKGDRYWKQTVSLGATAVFDRSTNSGSNPDYVDTKSVSVSKEAPKFTTLQVLGFGTVFKRTGTQPARATVTTQRQYRDSDVYTSGQYAALDLSVPAGFNFPSSNVITRDTEENRGLVNRRVREYLATEAST